MLKCNYAGYPECTVLVDISFVVLFFVLAVGQTFGQDARKGDLTSQSDNWAREFLATDPLVTKEMVTLQDLREAIEDESRRQNAISRHFGRVSEASLENKLDFLIEMLDSNYPIIQVQAAVELEKLGNFEVFVRDFLLNASLSTDKGEQEAAMVGLLHARFPGKIQSEEYLQAIQDFLKSEEPEVSDAAASGLREQGVAALPILLKLFRDGEHRSRLRAAKLLAELASSERQVDSDLQMSPYRSPMSEFGDSAQPVIPKAAPRFEPSHLVRRADEAAPRMVTIYFGTNRQRLEHQSSSWYSKFRYPGMVAIFIGGVFLAGFRLWENPRRGWTAYLLPILMLVGMFWTLDLFRNELIQAWRIDTHPGFGPRRDADDQVHYGTCDVSIPPTHVIGAVERPVLGPEDESVHVVLQRTSDLSQHDFYQALKSKIDNLPATDRTCFVFVHGFNVGFADAARRTAQIHHDLDFPGIPIFFSWPSRASVRHYFSDRNEIVYSRFVIQQFLSDLVDRLDADRIHVIAHSMGADATCQAIAGLGDRGRIFDHVVLAAPDIDRNVFRRQLAPSLINAANRTTLYCSRTDFALMASKTFNDAPRAGDSSQGALVIEEIDTVDASEIDTDLLGHSYYGDCIPILNDLRQLLGMNLPPMERKLKPWPVDNRLLYWTLPELRGLLNSDLEGGGL